MAAEGWRAAVANKAWNIHYNSRHCTGRERCEAHTHLLYTMFRGILCCHQYTQKYTLRTRVHPWVRSLKGDRGSKFTGECWCVLKSRERRYRIRLWVACMRWVVMNLYKCCWKKSKTLCSVCWRIIYYLFQCVILNTCSSDAFSLLVVCHLICALSHKAEL